LHAAAVKLPIIASAQNLAGTLLEDDVSAFVCETADPSCVSTKLKTFLGDNQIRIRFILRAEETVFSRIEQDYGEFLLAYRKSIERCMTEQR
jgi:glycosyltransferase involved in cell wall biosynthesis